MSALSWGRRYLMCPPQYFGVLYEINPWMSTRVVVDPDKARGEWEALVTTLEAAGATVERIEPVDGLPDLVFTANAGIVHRRQFVAANFSHPERQGETAHDVAWFAAADYAVAQLPDAIRHEGAGDALPFGGVLLSGYRFRSDVRAHVELGRLLGVVVRPVELVDERLYHFDLTFCPLDDRRAMIAPLGWDRYGLAVVEQLVPELLVLEDDEALAFCANSVVVGSTVVMSRCPPRVGRALAAFGFDVVESPVGEFMKAGGSCRCLTLALDVELDRT